MPSPKNSHRRYVGFCLESGAQLVLPLLEIGGISSGSLLGAITMTVLLDESDEFLYNRFGENNMVFCALHLLVGGNQDFLEGS